MSILEPEEIRYLSISIFTLIIMTSMVTFMALASIAWQPAEPSVPEDPQGNSIYDPVFWDTFDGVNFFQDDTFNQVVDTITDAFVMPVTVMNQWSLVISEAGWASGFLIVPSIVMLIIIVGAFIKVINAFPYT